MEKTKPAPTKALQHLLAPMRAPPSTLMVPTSELPQSLLQQRNVIVSSALQFPLLGTECSPVGYGGGPHVSHKAVHSSREDDEVQEPCTFPLSHHTIHHQKNNDHLGAIWGRDTITTKWLNHGVDRCVCIHQSPSQCNGHIGNHGQLTRAHTPVHPRLIEVN